jgi:DNA repair protein RadC
LDTKNRLLSWETVSLGTLSTSVVHPREVFKGAILANAASIILCHNHPSGDPKPSAEDIAITKRLAEAGKILGIDVLDHIIFGEEGFVSLKERNFVIP